MTLSERRQEAKAFAIRMRQQTECARCGSKPIDWHSYDHAKGIRPRVSRMVSIGASVEEIKAEMDRCTALCRSCHMAEDGRLRELIQNGERYRKTLTAPSPCITCGHLYKPLRLGLCIKCWRQVKLSDLDDSSYRGVHRTTSGRWAGYMYLGGKTTALGTFSTEEEAAEAVQLARSQWYENNGGPPPEHGLQSRYNRGCRCDACRTAKVRVNKAARARRKQNAV